MKTQIQGTRNARGCSLPRLWWAFAIAIALGSRAPAAEQRGLPAQHGILNFGHVNERLYRGAQPDTAGMSSLKQLGVKMVINLRMPDDVRAGEEGEASHHGIIYTNVPLAGVGRPSDEQVKRILALIATAAGPVFIHCEHGCDRTGTIVACYRIQRDHWTNAAALQEAEHYGLSKLERGMRKFISEFKPQPEPGG